MDIEQKKLSDEEIETLIRKEMAEGIKLSKCKKCGCMNEALKNLKNNIATANINKYSELIKDFDGWEKKMESIKYSCLGCEHCYPAAAMNIFNEYFPEKADTLQLDCSFEAKDDKWPIVAGEYYAFCGGDYCPVAVSTLGDSDLADRLAQNHPKELCIVGKTETENIGIDKVIKNTITNPTIKYLLLVGKEPMGHKSGETFLALSKYGIDDNKKVIGSTGKRPILRNVSEIEINAFIKQVEIVDMIGITDENIIIDKIIELSANKNSVTKGKGCGCVSCDDEKIIVEFEKLEFIQAKEPTNIIMDKAGYFVILTMPEKNIINVEHYSYDNTLLRVIEGKDARSIYWTIINNNLITLLSHAAYIGKELEKAELSLKYGFKYIQDGA